MTSTKYFAPSLRQRTDQPLAEPRPQRMKSQFRNSKQLTIKIRNPNIKIRNNIKIRMTKIPNCFVNLF